MKEYAVKIRPFTAILVALAFSTNALATNIDEIDAGDTLYVYGGVMGKDVKVTVIKIIDRSTRQLKVRREDDGSTAIVYAAQLMTKDEIDSRNSANHLAVGIAGAAAIYCAVSGCDKNTATEGAPVSPKNSTPLARAALETSPQNGGYSFIVRENTAGGFNVDFRDRNGNEVLRPDGSHAAILSIAKSDQFPTAQSVIENFIDPAEAAICSTTLPGTTTPMGLLSSYARYLAADLSNLSTTDARRLKAVVQEFGDFAQQHGVQPNDIQKHAKSIQQRGLVYKLTEFRKNNSHSCAFPVQISWRV